MTYAGHRGAALTSRQKQVSRALAAGVVSVVLLQRVAIPGLGLSVSLVVVPLIMAWLLVQGLVVEDAFRTRLYVGGVMATSVAALLASMRGHPGSLQSLLLLTVLYMPFCVRIAPDCLPAYPAVLRFFSGAMVVVALAAIVQMATQLVGGTYHDPFAGLPTPLLIHGYNTSYPVTYGSSLFKSNGIFLLEPSLCSQFLALAVTVQLLLGKGRWRILLFVAGILCTVSGTGVILAVGSLTVLAARRGGRWALSAMALVAVGVAVLASTGLGTIYANRAAEVRQPDSSASLRFVQPLQRAYERMGDSGNLLTGLGPGFADREAKSYFLTTGRPLNYTALPKLLIEYGVLAGALFAVFIVAAFVRGVPSPTLAVSAILLVFLLSGSLLQPPTVYAAAIFTSFFARPEKRRRIDPPLQPSRLDSLPTGPGVPIKTANTG